jgi:excisionase family DNA binding protein
VVQKPESRREGDQGEKPPEFFTVGQLASLLQLTEMTIYRMVNRGELPCYSIGRVKRFRRNDIEEFLESCRIPAPKRKHPPA